jgi:hypothetical protein
VVLIISYVEENQSLRVPIICLKSSGARVVPCAFIQVWGGFSCASPLPTHMPG